jgi:hypothetical protein
MPIGQPAVMSKNDEDIARFKEISRGFIRKNVEQAKTLGAKSIALFCGACEPHYTNMKDEIDLEVISFSELIDRYFTGGKLADEIDYYAGCYRFRRKLTDKPVDLDPAMRVMGKIEGLKINYLENQKCCYIPPHLDQLMDAVKTKSIVNICTGCYFNLSNRLRDPEGFKAKMLPEIVWDSLSAH